MAIRISITSDTEMMELVDKYAKEHNIDRKEVKLIHHIIDIEWGREMRPVPFQSRKWWEFWKTP